MGMIESKIERKGWRKPKIIQKMFTPPIITNYYWSYIRRRMHQRPKTSISVEWWHNAFKQENSFCLGKWSLLPDSSVSLKDFDNRVLEPTNNTKLALYTNLKSIGEDLNKL